MAERLRSEVEALRFESAKGPFNVTISLGLATWGVDSTEPDSLIECADQALYECKESGRNCARAWSELGR